MTIHDQLGFVYEKLRDLPNAAESFRIAGNTSSLARVESNLEIAQDNRDIESHNAEVIELERQRKELEAQINALPGSTAPEPRR